jgi:hypothetical protein
MMKQVIRVKSSTSTSYKEFICNQEEERCNICRLRFRCWTNREDIQELMLSDIGAKSIEDASVNLIAIYLLEEGVEDAKKHTRTTKNV